MYRVLSKARWYTAQMDKPRTRRDRREGGSDRRDESRPEGSNHHAHRGERQQVRKERRKKEGRKKEKGQMKQETREQRYTKVFLSVCFLGLR